MPEYVEVVALLVWMPETDAYPVSVHTALVGDPAGPDSAQFSLIETERLLIKVEYPSW